jgi:hypothetical protein
MPEGLGGLMSLKKLDMWECVALEEIHFGLNNLSMHVGGIGFL